MRTEKGKLGDYIERVKEVIPYNKEIPVKGISNNKQFIETNIANLDRVVAPFQLVKRGQFAYVPVTSRRGNKFALAFNGDLERLQISNTYVVFQIINPNLLNCFYLELFFKRFWIDKIARYAATGGVREELSWKRFCDFPITVPSLELQEKIIARYQAVSKYVSIKKRINELLERKMIAYYHILFDDLKDYEIKSFGELFSIIRGGGPPRSNRAQREKYFCKEGGIPWLQVKDATKQQSKFVNYTSEQLSAEGLKKWNYKLVLPNDLIFISSTSSKFLGKIFVNQLNLTINSNFWAFSNNLARGGHQYSLPITFIYFLIQENIWHLQKLINSSTSILSFQLGKFQAFKVKIPKNKEWIDQFNNFCEPIFELQKRNEQIIQKFLRLQKCWVESLD